MLAMTVIVKLLASLTCGRVTRIEQSGVLSQISLNTDILYLRGPPNNILTCLALFVAPRDRGLLNH